MLYQEVLPDLGSLSNRSAHYQGDFEPGFMVHLQQKDLKLVLQAAMTSSKGFRLL